MSNVEPTLTTASCLSKILFSGEFTVDADYIFYLSPQGCARFAEIASELTKTWSSGATEFGAIAMLKCENLPRTNSTKYETQNILVKFQQNEHTPGSSDLLSPRKSKIN